MNAIDKAYFTLEEIEERWQLPHRDVVYLAENGLLKLSVRLFDVRMECGEFEDLGNGDWNRIPTDQRWFSGLQDLREHDAFRLFRDGEVAIDQFAVPEEHHYCHLREPTDSLTIRVCDVVVQRQERDRVEHQQGLAGATRPAVTSIFRQVSDYGEVHVAGRVFNLGHVQSRVVKQLHRAAIVGRSLVQRQGAAGRRRLVQHARCGSLQIAAGLAAADRVRPPGKLSPAAAFF